MSPQGEIPAQRAKRRLERETGVEPATSTLARWRSTTELFPLGRAKDSGAVRPRSSRDEIHGGAAAVLADADRLASEFLLGSAVLTERAPRVVAAEEGHLVGVGAATGRRAHRLSPREIEKRLQERQVAGRDRPRLAHADAVGLDQVAGADQVAQPAA